MGEQRQYDVIFEPQPEGGYTAYVPDVPGCVSEGRTLDEASEMIRDAMSGYLASLKDRGHQLPRGSSIVSSNLRERPAPAPHRQTAGQGQIRPRPSPCPGTAG